MIYDLVVVGGGASGFFAAINAAMLHKGLKIIILEKSNRVLQKVKISGGGRCNVTNVISEPSLLSQNYPRGEDFLIKPFNSFTSADTVSWFQKQGIELKSEKDGRIFPKSNSSQTIIDCFLELCNKYNIQIEVRKDVIAFSKKETYWEVVSNEEKFTAQRLLIATGNAPSFWRKLEGNGFSVVNPVPSLFTFTLKNKDITQLSGLSVQDATATIKGYPFVQSGPILITHWGFSGPSILKLSSQAAIQLSSLDYHFTLQLSWINNSTTDVLAQIKKISNTEPKKNILSHNPFNLPSRLWKYLCEKIGIRHFQNWAETGNKQHSKLAEVLTADSYEIVGKSTNKDEFVTAGGVEMSQINLSTYEHIANPGLYFAGEVLNIDGYTGGFNFQAAWTSGYLVAKAIK